MKTRPSTYEKLFAEFLPTTIKVAEHPPTHPNFKVEELTVQEFEKRMNVNWCETVLYNPKEEKKIIDSDFEKSPSISEEELTEKLKKIRKVSDTFIICNMGELGYGLYGSVKENTIVSIYTGEKKIYNNQSKQQRSLQKEDDTYYMHVARTHKDINVLINAKEYGNHSRYMQHAFEISSKQGINANDIVFTEEGWREKLVTANLELEIRNYNGNEIVFFKATQTVNNGPLVFSYGDFWREKGEAPSLISKGNEIISPEKYRFTRVQFKLIINSRLALYETFTEKEFSKMQNTNLEFYTCFMQGVHLPGVKKFDISSKDFEKACKEKSRGAYFLIFKHPTSVEYTETVIGYLQRLTEVWGYVLDWKFNSEKKIAWLQDDNINEEQMLAIENCYKEKLDISFGRDKNNIPTLRIKNITKEKLAEIEPLSKRINSLT